MKTCVLFAAFTGLLLAQGPAQSPLLSLPPETEVAKVDGKPVTVADIRKILDSDPLAVRVFQEKGPEMFLQQIFMMRFLVKEADKVGLPEQSPLKEQLELNRQSLIAGAMFNYMRESYVPSEEAINDFYKQNQSRYEKARIKVITVAFRPSAPTTGTSAEEMKKAVQAAMAQAGSVQRSEEDAKKIASELVMKLRVGADFVKLVAENSDDAESKAKGGDFGTVTRTSSYADEIKRAVFALKPGEVSDPVKSGTSYYIIRIEDRSVQPINEVHEPIAQELKQKHFTDWFGTIEKQYKPVILRPDAFGKAAAAANQPPQLVPPAHN